MIVAICGTHFTPALAVMEVLSKRHRDAQILFFGRRYTTNKTQAESLEFKTLKNKKEVIYFDLISGRWQRYFDWSNLLTPILLSWGFCQAIYCLLKYRPHVIISFGGYSSVPVVFAGGLLGIPVISHEQTLNSGLSTILNSLFSKKICVSWPESLAFYPSQKAVLTGLPLRKSILAPLPTHWSDLKDKNKPIILVTGGNQGSHYINTVVGKILKELLTEFILIHQCGGQSEFQDEKKLYGVLRTLPQNLQDNYYLLSHIPQDEMGNLMQIANLVICRSGINTVAELFFLRKKAILVPLPFSQKDEQLKNARLLADFGFAKIIDQADLSPKRLLGAISQMLNHEFSPQTAISSELFINAAEKICDEIDKYL